MPAFHWASGYNYLYKMRFSLSISELYFVISGKAITFAA